MVVGDFETELDTVVIGSGPGGYVAAIRAAQLGKKVAIIEKDFIGGTCLNVGCIPSKALIHASHDYYHALNEKTKGVHAKDVTIDFEEVQEWKDKEVVSKLTGGVEMLLKKNKVTILNGAGYFMDEHRLRVMHEFGGETYSFQNVIIATGSRPLEIKGFKFGKRILDSTGLLNLKEIPKKLVVIGGGYIGSELAGVYASLGTDVTILEGAPSILPNFEKDMVKLVEKNFKEKNVTIETKAMAKSAVNNKDSVTVTYEVEGKEKSIEADYVMVSVGRRPNTDELGLDKAGVEMDERGLIKVDERGETTAKGIYAIGDVTAGLALAHKASYEAKVVAEVIAGQDVIMDYQAIPAVCFTEPELASVGLTKAEAKEQDVAVTVSKFPFAANGRALSLGATDGFMQLVSEKETGKLLGAQIAGVGASDMIAELVLAIEADLTIEDLALTIHPHPSLSETIMDAAEIGLGLPIHV